MKKTFVAFLLLSTTSIFADDAVIVLKKGERALVNNKNEELIFVACNNMTSIKDNNIIIEQESSLNVTLGYEMIVVNENNQPILVKAGEKVNLKCTGDKK